jgi:hypothetical protein
MRLHRWQSSAAMPPGWGCKRRKRSARYVLPLGNAYLACQGATARVLPLGDWMSWELAVAQVLGRATNVAADGAGLVIPSATGKSLGTILREDGLLVDKLSALKSAASALRELHTKSMHRTDAPRWPLSHGDATCDNTIVNATADRAEWIDFDMRHEWSLGPDERHADDLRALVFSAAASLPASLHGACVESLLDGYGEPGIVRKLGQLLEAQGCPNVFQLAQGAVSYTDYCELRRLLRRRGLTTAES